MKDLHRVLVRAICLALVSVPIAATVAFAQTEQVYFPAVDNVTAVLVSKIDAETARVDMSAWYLTEHAVSIALVNALKRGVQVRLIGDRGSIFEIDRNTRNEFYWLASQGVPIRLRVNPTWFPEIDHMKATIFKGQGLVAFGSANYTPNQLAPASASNYSDETVLFTTDASLVNAFLSKFDQYWNDTTPEPNSIISGPPYFRNWDDACAGEAACADYRVQYPNPAPMIIDTARLEPDSATPPDLIWGQGPEFNNRLVQEINAEGTRIDFAIYRLTVDNITQALLDRFRAGIPTRLIIEPAEYLNRKWPEFWLTHANLDKLWAAGVPMKQRQHAGLTHMKMLVTSRYATNASSNFASNWQRDNDYFVPAATKPGLYQAMADRFATMWNDAAGFAPFVPQPPDVPTLASPADGSTGASQAPTLTWNAAPFATSYDVYLGTSPDGLSLVGNVAAALVNNPPATYSWKPGASLAAGTTYYWRVQARTNATARNPALVAASPVASFATGGSGGPAPLTGAPGPVTAGPAPFGQIDTPVQNAGGVVGSLAVTGWALDDVGVTGVKIYRNCLSFENQGNCQSVGGHSVVFIGDAVFVPGARPDVEAAFPAHPQSGRAGWGYLLLTNMLPDVANGRSFGGVGPIALLAFASDAAGNLTLLGRSRNDHTPTSITLANDTATKPFGALDTPGQGQTVSGALAVFGWALTPDANTTADAGDILVPPDGSTIHVFIDGVDVGRAAYNGCRGTVGSPVPAGVFCDDDVSNIFGNPTPRGSVQPRSANPTRFRNLDAGRGAIGSFVVDTTSLADGVHTIVWGVTDSAGRSEGIGSRYFTVQNASASAATPSARRAAGELAGLPAIGGDARALEHLPLAAADVREVVGLAGQAREERLLPAEGGKRQATLPELGRLEIALGRVDRGYLVVNGTLRDLPVGSRLDPAKGTFTWAPGPGYVGTYDLAFVRGKERIPLAVRVAPAFAAVAQTAGEAAEADEPAAWATDFRFW